MRDPTKVAEKRVAVRRKPLPRWHPTSGKMLPLYLCVKLEVTRLLSSGQVKVGEPMPTEKQLAARYRVSVGTVRRAMDDLVTEHVVVREQGRGTFLVPLSAERLLNRFWPIFRKDGTRQIPFVQTVLFKNRAATREVSKALGIQPRERIYHIVNVLFLEGKPVMLDDVRVPQFLFPGLTEQEFISRGMAMYGLYLERNGVRVLQTVDHLRGIGASEEVASHLDIPVSTPLLAFTRIAYTFEEKPVEFRRTYIHTDSYDYQNVISGAGPATKAPSGVDRLSNGRSKRS